MKQVKLKQTFVFGRQFLARFQCNFFLKLSLLFPHICSVLEYKTKTPDQPSNITYNMYANHFMNIHDAITKLICCHWNPTVYSITQYKVTINHLLLLQFILFPHKWKYTKTSKCILSNPQHYFSPGHLSSSVKQIVTNVAKNIQGKLFLPFRDVSTLSVMSGSRNFHNMLVARRRWHSYVSFVCECLITSHLYSYVCIMIRKYGV